MAAKIALVASCLFLIQVATAFAISLQLGSLSAQDVQRSSDVRASLICTLMFSALASVSFSALAAFYLQRNILRRLLLVKARCESRVVGSTPLPPLKGRDEIAQLDQLLSRAHQEWTKLTQQDCSLFENLAVEDERKRISSDINKLIMPHLATILKHADASEDKLFTSDVNERMAVIVAGVGAVMSELHPRLLAEAGLVSSIRTLVDRFKRASLVETVLVTNVPSDHHIDVSLEAKFAIYRVTQEALNNIEKHACATRARVTVNQNDEGLTVLIEDNGKGFQETGSTQSRGLKNIRSRALEIGAQVVWQKAVSFESGTLLTITLRPL